MTFTADQQTNEALQMFQGFDADTQLALLWYGYLDLKDQLTPTNDPAQHAISRSLVDQIQALSPEEQLEAQRNIIACADTDVTHAYSALSSSAKLSFWLQLAQAMDEGSVIQVPSDYQLPSETDRFSELIKSLDFEQRINFSRSAVVAMGAQPIDR
jgi:hypothetical protein